MLTGAEMGMEWFYEKDRQKFGPISEAELRDLVGNGRLGQNNLVWTESFGADWKPISATDLMSKQPGPPPLPSTHIDNTFAWLIAFVPLVGEVIEMAIAQRTTVSAGGLFVAYAATYVALAALDVRRIKASGNAVDTTPFQNWWILIPVYLFKRANALGQSKAYFWTWIAAIVASVMISGDAKSLLDKDTYWGSGLPACDSNYMKSQTQQIFRDIPLMKARGIVAVEVKNARQISGDSKQKRCSATFVTSLGRDLQGTYTITMQENDQFFTTLELE